MCKKIGRVLIAAGLLWFGVLSGPAWADDGKCSPGFGYFSLDTDPSRDFGIGGADERYMCRSFVDSLKRRSLVVDGWICANDLSADENGYFDPCSGGGEVTWAGNAYSCSYSSVVPKKAGCAKGFDRVESYDGSDACAPPADFCCYNSSPCGEEGEMVASEANRVCCVKYGKSVVEESKKSRKRSERTVPER